MDPLEPAAAFTYLGRKITYNNINCEDLYQNLGKARMWWDMVSRLPEKKGATERAREILYKAVVQTALIYGTGSWVITEAKMKVLEEFHHRIGRRFMEKTDRRII